MRFLKHLMKNRMLIIGLVLSMTLLTAYSSTKEVTDESITLTDADGNSYAGTYTGTLNGKTPTGKGTFTYEDGWVFDGEFEDLVFSRWRSKRLSFDN